MLGIIFVIRAEESTTAGCFFFPLSADFAHDIVSTNSKQYVLKQSAVNTLWKKN